MTSSDPTLLTGSASRPQPQPPPPPPPPPLSRSSIRQPMLQTPALDYVESVDLYKPGGHHPVNLGDVLGEKFKVIHKLGNGGFALVWLARDLQNYQYVALKILRADSPNREISTLKHIQTAAIRAIRIANLHETFTIRGPNGFHQCLVMEFGGPNLEQLILNCKRPSLRFLKNASQKLAEGVAAIHLAGICQGDLTNSNVVFELKDFHAWPESKIYRCFGQPKTAPLLLYNDQPAPSFAPTHVVSALDYSSLDIDDLSSNVLIIDFGQAFYKSNIPKTLGTPASFFAPEMLFQYPPSYAADIWALGCLIFEIHTSNILFPTGFGSNLEALAIAVETIGALPKRWSDRARDKDNPLQMELGHDHHWFDDTIQRTRTLDSQISRLMPDLSQDQCASFVELLGKIFVFEPTHRLSVEAIVAHPWFGG